MLEQVSVDTGIGEDTEDGIKIAVPTVHVEGGGEDAGAAAGQIVKMRQDAALAAQAANEA